MRWKFEIWAFLISWMSLLGIVWPHIFIRLLTFDPWQPLSPFLMTSRSPRQLRSNPSQLLDSLSILPDGSYQSKIISCHTFSARHSLQAAPRGLTKAPHGSVTTAPQPMWLPHVYSSTPVGSSHGPSSTSKASSLHLSLVSSERVSSKSLVSPEWYFLCHFSAPHGSIAAPDQLPLRPISASSAPHALLTVFVSLLW